MYTITNEAMLLSMLLETIFFYVYISILINKQINGLKIRQMLFFGLCGFLIYFVADVFQPIVKISSEILSNIFVLLTIYGIFYQDFPRKEGRRELKIRILFGYASIQTVFLIVSFIQFRLFSNATGIKGIGFILLIQGIEFLLAGILLILYKKINLIRLFHEGNRKLILNILIGYNLTFIIFNTIFANLDLTKISQTKAFNLSILIFISFEFVFAIVLYNVSQKFKKQQYEKLLMKQELLNLKEYTDTLETEQRRLRKFKHDYQNLILSLEEIVREEHSKLLPKYIETFKKYVDNNFNDNKLFLFNDFDNIENSYLKSIIISQVYRDTEAGIEFHFECHEKTGSDFKIENFDLVRILGILLDNAREAALGTKAKKINIMIYREASNLEIYIENSIDQPIKNFDKLEHEGMSTKDDHLGVGLTNISEIKRKYDNLLINYAQNEQYFKTKIVITGIK